MQFSTRNSSIIIACLLVVQIQLYSQDLLDLPPSYLALTSDNVVYDMSMNYKEYYGSGLLVLKRTSNSNYHGVFLSKVGLKLMEFSIVDGTFKWIKLIAYIDKKATRKLFERDFSMIMLSDMDEISKTKKIKSKNDLERFKVWGNHKLMVVVRNDVIEQIENRGFFNFVKTKITFHYDKESTPKSVSLTHRNLKVKLQLELLEQ